MFRYDTLKILVLMLAPSTSVNERASSHLPPSSFPDLSVQTSGSLSTTKAIPGSSITSLLAEICKFCVWSKWNRSLFSSTKSSPKNLPALGNSASMKSDPRLVYLSFYLQSASLVWGTSPWSSSHSLQSYGCTSPCQAPRDTSLPSNYCH